MGDHSPSCLTETVPPVRCHQRTFHGAAVSILVVGRCALGHLPPLGDLQQLPFLCVLGRRTSFATACVHSHGTVVLTQSTTIENENHLEASPTAMTPVTTLSRSTSSFSGACGCSITPSEKSILRKRHEWPRRELRSGRKPSVVGDSRGSGGCRRSPPFHACTLEE